MREPTTVTNLLNAVQNSIPVLTAVEQAQDDVTKTVTALDAALASLQNDADSVSSRVVRALALRHLVESVVHVAYRRAAEAQE